VAAAVQDGVGGQDVSAVAAGIALPGQPGDAVAQVVSCSLLEVLPLTEWLDQRFRWSDVEPPVGIERMTFSLRGGTTPPHLLSTSGFSNKPARSKCEIPHEYPRLHATSDATHVAT
jgi:hypothetical protein